MGRAKDTERPSLGPGKGALLVAKELAFRQGRSQGRTVNRNEGLIRPRAAAMQQPSPEFFAGARLTTHQHRALHLGGTLNRAGDPPHRGIVAKHPVGLGCVVANRLLVSGSSSRSPIAGNRYLPFGLVAGDLHPDDGIERAPLRIAGSCVGGTIV